MSMTSTSSMWHISVRSARNTWDAGCAAQHALGLVNITDGCDLELGRQALESGDMLPADAAPDNANPEHVAHWRFPNLAARSSASNANCEARKQCTCGIAVSVRLSMSAINRLPYGNSTWLQSIYWIPSGQPRTGDSRQATGDVNILAQFDVAFRARIVMRPSPQTPIPAVCTNPHG